MADRKEKANRRNEQIDRKPRKGKKNAKPLLLLLIACILGIIAPFAFNTKLKIQHYSLKSEKLTAPVRIVLITDLHSCSYGEGQRELIDAIHAQKPDILKYTDKNCSITEQLKDAALASENGNYTILLAHRPELIGSYLNYDFDLILAGHAHGGQWRLPGIINGLFAPNQGFFPRYAGGKYRFDDSYMIVSRGLARESTRIPRIFNRPELVVIDLS